MCRNQLQNFTRNLALGSSPAGCGAFIKALAHHCASGTVHMPEERSELGISYLHSKLWHPELSCKEKVTVNKRCI